MIIVRKIAAVISFLGIFFLISCSEAGKDVEPVESATRIVIDSRGFEVAVPGEIRRVVSISDGLVEGVLEILGESDKLVGIGSSCLIREFNYDYELDWGGVTHFKGGMNPVRMLNPDLIELPVIVQSGAGINLESLISLKPDVVIVRIGDCSVDNLDESFEKVVQILEKLEIPVVVLLASHLQDSPDPGSISREIEIIGSIFGKEKEAEEITNLLESKVAEIKARIPLNSPSKPSVLLLGLSGRGGGVANVMGRGTIESYFVEGVLGAKNAFQDEGYFKILNTEQILSLTPDVVVLYTAAGYHPPVELSQSPRYRLLRTMKAVKNNRVVALPWTPCNCDKRLEYPLDLMIIASAAYPESFRDLEISEWIMQFYQDLYGVDKEMAEKLLVCQWLNWTRE